MDTENAAVTHWWDWLGLSVWLTGFTLVIYLAIQLERWQRQHR